MIDWGSVYKLSAGEFADDPDNYAEPELIYSLGKLRKLLGTRMYPSPVKGSLARLDGSPTSQHYAVGRLSTACDVFIEGVPFEIFPKIMHSRLFTGIGIYLETRGADGKPWVMFHLDIRKRDYPFIWIVVKTYDTKTHKRMGKYCYPSYDSNHWRLLNDDRFFKNKQYGIG